jgi:FrmR/RcnR family transcriptional regulator, repressor of frmRAB operon
MPTVALLRLVARKRFHENPKYICRTQAKLSDEPAENAAMALAFAAKLLYTPVGMKSSTAKPSDAEKQKLVKRLSRIRGQLDALQRAIVEQDAPSAKLLHQATACRGAMDGFIAEVIEDHIREKVVDAHTKDDASRAAEELIGIVHTYLT